MSEVARTNNSKILKENIISYVYLLPFLAVFLVFLGYPVIYSLYLSFHKTTIYSDWYNVFGTMQFIGLDNYIRLFTVDKEFWWSLIATFYYGFLTIPTGIFLSLLLAMLINNKLFGASFFRSAYFLPNVLDLLVIGIIWILLYSPQYGVIDVVLNQFGITYFSAKGFLGDPATVLPAIAFAMVLKGAGFGMVLFLTAIQNIDPSVYEAADIDGANWWEKLWFITIPLVKPIILFMVITGTIGCLNAFTEIYSMTSNTGGPTMQAFGATVRSAQVAGYLLYKNFSDGFYGYAAAISFVLLAIALVISVINMKVLKSDD